MKNTIRQPERRQEDIILEELLTHRTMVSDTPENIAKMVVYNGKVWKSERALCRAYGIDVTSVFTRKKRFNCSFYEAIEHYVETGLASEPTEELESQNLALCYRGEYYHSPSSAAQAYGLNRYYMSKMLCTGATFESAMDYLIGRTYRTRKAA